MIWCNIRSDERLRLWKNLRILISELSLDEQLDEIAKFCFQMPIGSRTLDFYTPKSWPTPWEILYNGAWCINSISLLIFYTLTMLPTFNNKIELLLVEDSSDRYLLPLIDNYFILNYELGQVSTWDDIKNNFRIVERYTEKEIKKIT